MVYLKKRRKNILLRIAVIAVFIVFLLIFTVGTINKRIDGIITELARTGLKNTITKIINEAVSDSMSECGNSDIIDISYDADERVRSINVSSVRVNLIRADVSARISERLGALRKFYVDVDISNVFDDAVILGGCPIKFSVDIIPVGGVETDVESELVSAGINQTNYRMNIKVKASVTADVISAFTVDISTSVNIIDMIIVGDVPTVYFG